MKITVWGGSGFLGSHVCDAFSNAGHDVVVADEKESKWLSRNQKMFIGSINNEDDVEKSIDDSEIVFNFAGMADIEESNKQPIISADNNIIGNLKILEACKRSKSLKKFIFASTLYVYSTAGGFYRCSKQASEEFIQEYSRQFNLPFLILRFGSLYGLRATETNGIFKYLKNALESGEISYAGDENAKREYIHVEDAARICLELVENKTKNEFFTLTGTQSISIKELVQLISEILGKDISLKNNTSIDKMSHYQITPYKHKVIKSKKYTLPIHIDLGEGLLELIKNMN